MECPKRRSSLVAEGEFRHLTSQELHRRAEDGSPFAQYMLGVVFTEGIGVQANDKQASEWLSLCGVGLECAQEALSRANSRRSSSSFVIGERGPRRSSGGSESNQPSRPGDSAAKRIFSSLSGTLKGIRPLSAAERRRKRNHDGGNSVDIPRASRGSLSSDMVTIPEDQLRMGLDRLCSGEVQEVWQRHASEAFAELHRRAEGKCAESQLAVGQCYLEGTGVERQVGEGIKWVTAAVEGGSAAAKLQLARCHMAGIGVAQDLARAFELLSDCATSGHGGGICELAMFHEKGLGTSMDPSVALQLYEKSSQAGCGRGTRELARCYLDGVGRMAAEETGMELLGQAAEGSDMESYYTLGQRHLHGVGALKPDDAQAAFWTTLAARQGHVGAQEALASWHATGRVIGQSNAAPVEGAVWLIRAAENLADSALLKLARMCMAGDEAAGVAADNERAAMLYALAADSGCFQAVVALGWLHREGKLDGGPEAARELFERAEIMARESPVMLCTLGKIMILPVDGESAQRCYLAAVKCGHVAAYHLLGQMHAKGHGVPVSWERAVEYFTQAAELEVPDGMFALGICHIRGQGTPQDPKKGLEWIKKAADVGHPASAGFVGECYGKGRHGCPVDHKEAVRWYRMGAHSGFTTAQNNLGVCYQKGLGVVMDAPKALSWYEKSARQGDKLGQHNLATMLSKGQGGPRDIGGAIEWWHKSSMQGHAPAQLSLGLCYYKGIGVGQHYGQGVRMIRMAAEKGIPQACMLMAECYAEGRGVKCDDTKAEQWRMKGEGKAPKSGSTSAAPPDAPGPAAPRPPPSGASTDDSGMGTPRRADVHNPLRDADGNLTPPSGILRPPGRRNAFSAESLAPPPARVKGIRIGSVEYMNT